MESPDIDPLLEQLLAATKIVEELPTDAEDKAVLDAARSLCLASSEVHATVRLLPIDRVPPKAGHLDSVFILQSRACKALEETQSTNAEVLNFTRQIYRRIRKTMAVRREASFYGKALSL